MSAVEICSRLWRGLRDRWTYLPGDPGAGLKAEPGWLLPLLDRTPEAWPTAGQAKQVPGSEKVLSRASEALSGSLYLFGRTVETGMPPDWLADPLTGRSAREFVPALTGFSPGRGGEPDIRSVWELNRLQVLADLGRAYSITSQTEYAEAAARIIESWSEANPYGRTVNWANALEVGLRALSLVQAALLVSGSAAAGRESFRRVLARLFFLHGRYLRKHLSRGSTAFNHLAGEGAALTVLGACLPGLPGAGKWRALGESALGRSVDRLILPDGGGLEGSLHYLALVCRLVVLSCRLTGDCALLERRRRRERLVSAYRFLCAATDGGRSISEYGDSDDASAPGPPPAEASQRYRSTLNLLYLFLGDQPLCHGYEPDPDSLWLFGSRALEPAGRKPPGPERPEVGRFGFSGRYVVRWPGSTGSPAGFLRFECGPWGAPGTWAHAHADRLSFSFFLEGRPFFIDPGTGAYLANPRWREYFRSTAAHNTVVIDGQSQGQPLGTFFWRKEVPSRLLRLEETGDEVVLAGEHYGYRGQGVVHRREILLRPAGSSLELTDTFITGRRHQVAAVFNLHPQCIVERKPGEAGTLVIISGANQETGGWRLELKCDERCRVSLHSGEDNPARGWFSPGFMRREPCPQVICRAEIEGESSLHTRILWSKPDAGQRGS
ncbi:MAG: alginate lyase family protein [Candidatus Glassbacteria bacterium]|nr:alginate lyase family protein [Candidatus Glassbacteria bacterium]